MARGRSLVNSTIWYNGFSKKEFNEFKCKIIDMSIDNVMLFKIRFSNI